MNRVRRVGLAAGVLLVSCLVGCDSATPPPEVATPSNPQKGLEALKKLQEGAKPTAKGMQPAPGEAPKK